MAKAKEKGMLYESGEWKQFLPKVERNQHKYQRGYVLVWAGSPKMPGAAILCCMGALRGGAGIVRWFHGKEMGYELSSAPWEIIREPLADLDAFLHETARAGCVALGPGLGRQATTLRMGRKLIEKSSAPLVIDADGLFLLPPKDKIPEGTILTPHRGEIKLLIGDYKTEFDMLHAAQKYVDKTEVTLLCKGAPTILFHKGKKPLFLPVGNPGMATAGSGDVLSGVIAALRAAKVPPYEAAMVGAILHGKAGDIAAKKKGVRSMIASDLLDALPDAF